MGGRTTFAESTQVTFGKTSSIVACNCIVPGSSHVDAVHFSCIDGDSRRDLGPQSALTNSAAEVGVTSTRSDKGHIH